MYNITNVSGSPEKKSYQTPTLVCFGSLADLTAAGSGDPGEQSQGACGAWGQIKRGGPGVSRACP